MVTRYRSEIRQRWVTRVVFVPNGQCESAVELAPVAGRTYLLQYPPAQGRASKKAADGLARGT